MKDGKMDRGAIPRAALELLEKLASAGHRGWLVGGCVRDHLLSRAVTDWDVCTDALPEQVVKLFARTLPTGLAHGTVTVLLGRVGYEVTTLRGEQGFSDGRRPDHVEFVSDLREDLARRDFTVNAIAYDALGDRLEDPFDGLGDLERRVLRAVGVARERFAEDGLRVLRAARFVATLEFALEADTEAAIGPNLPTFRKVSRERVHDEWKKTMKARAPSVAFAVMKRTGILASVCPALDALDKGAWRAALARMDALDKGDPVLRLAGLLCSLTEPALGEWLEQWRFSHDEHKRVAHAARWLPALTRTEPADRVAVRRLLRGIGRESFTDLARLSEALPDAREATVLTALGEELASKVPLTLRELAVNGGELQRELGMAPSKKLGEMLAELLERVTVDPALNEKAALLALARAML